MAKILVNERFIAKVLRVNHQSSGAIGEVLARETYAGWTNTGVCTTTNKNNYTYTALAFQKRIPAVEVELLENVDEISNDELINLLKKEEIDFCNEFRYSKTKEVNLQCGLVVSIEDFFHDRKWIVLKIGSRRLAFSSHHGAFYSKEHAECYRVYDLIWQGHAPTVYFVFLK